MDMLLAVGAEISLNLSLEASGGEECEQHPTDDAKRESRSHMSYL
jgi:hypothetical protein